MAIASDYLTHEYTYADFSKSICQFRVGIFRHTFALFTPY
jgi:hypothetical protein